MFFSLWGWFSSVWGAPLVLWKWVYLFNRVIAHLPQLVSKQLLWSPSFPLIAKLLLNWRTLSRLVQPFSHWQALWSQAVNCILKRNQKRVLQNSNLKMLAVVQWRPKRLKGNHIKLHYDKFSLWGWLTRTDGVRSGWVDVLVTLHLHLFRLVWSNAKQ